MLSWTFGLSAWINPMLLPHLVAMEATIDPVQWLVNYGVAGIVIGLIVTGQLHTKSEIASIEKRVEAMTKVAEDRLKDSRDKDAALQAVIQQITNSTVPTLSRVASVMESLPDRTSEADLVSRLAAITRRIETIDRHRSEGGQ